MSASFEHGDECEPRWERYPMGLSVNNADKEAIGRVTCLHCDRLLEFGITEKEWKEMVRRAKKEEAHR